MQNQNPLNVGNAMRLTSSNDNTRYNSVMDKKTGVVFYIDTANENCLLTVPRETTLAWVLENSEGTGRVIGQRREWEVNGCDCLAA